MSSELAKREAPSAAITPRNLDELFQMANSVAKSGLYGVKRAEEAFVVMVTGGELGLSPMQSLRGIHCISGKPVLSADLMVALVKASAQCELFELVSIDDQQCTYRSKRVDSAVVQERSYTMADAKTAGLTGGNWNKHPKAMLRARASSTLARQEFPEVCLGLYTADELSDGRVADADFDDLADAPNIDVVALLSEGAAKLRFLTAVADHFGITEEAAKLEAARMWKLAALKTPCTADELADAINAIVVVTDDNTGEEE